MSLPAPPAPARALPWGGLALAAALLLASCGGGSGGAQAPAPTISVFAAGQSLLTAGNSTPLTAVYADGTGTVDHGVGAFPSGTSILVSPGWDTTYTLTVTGAAGARAVRSTVIQVVAPPVVPVISAPASALAGQPGLQASIAPQAGCSYAWTLTGGTLTSAATGSSVTFTAGQSGSIALACTAINAAGTQSAQARLTIPISTVPSTPVLTAPSIVTANLPGYTASALPQAGCTLAWTISGGLFESGATGSPVTFTAAPGGTVILGCRAVSAAGVSSPTALATCLIAPAPIRPVITAPTLATAGASGLTAAVVPQVGCSFTWGITGGTLLTGQSTSRITFTAGSAGTVILTCTATNTAGTPSPQGTALIPVVPVPDPPAITAPAFVTAAQPGYTASVPPQPGCSYAWSIAGGTVTSGAGTSGIAFTPGTGGTVTLGCVVTNAAGYSAPPASATCTVLPYPATPVISAPSPVNLGATGLIATAPSQVGCTFAWAISGGSITSGADTPSITFTAGVAGTLTLSCVATNAAGSASAPGTAQVTVVSTPVSTISAPAIVTGGLPGYLATVPTQSGCTYLWTITGGTITAGAGTPSIAFTPSASGAVILGCVVTNAVGTNSPPGTATCPIAPMPVTPLISAPVNATANQAGYSASVPVQAACTYAWTITGGAITSGAGTAAITFTPGAAGTLLLGCTVTNAAGTASPPGSATVTVASPPVATVTAPTSVTASLPGYTATVVAQAGCTYAWTIAGGTLTSGAGSTTVTFTPDPAGTTVLTCVLTNAAGTASLPGAATCIIVAAPLVPIITAPGSATANQAGYTASVPAQTGATYAWTLTGGTLTGGNGTNAITFTAGAVGTLNLSCVATNAAGTPSAAGSGAVAVITAPVAPVTAPTSATLGQGGYSASVPTQAGSTYAWTITNGALTSSASASLVTFTAGATGTTTDLSCIVTNAAGTPSLPGTASCTLVAAPPAALIAAPADVTANQAGYSASAPSQAGCTYAWTITNGTLTAGNGSATITYVAGGAGTVVLGCTITNSAGTSSAPGSASSNIHAIPSAPITAPAFVTASQAGYLASVPNQGGCTYAWSAVGGTITSGVNTSILTFTAGSSGTVNLGCVVTNAAGTPSTPGSFSCQVLAAPATPVITAPAFVTAIAPGYTASTPVQAGCSFGWTVLGGNITGGNGTNTITFTPGTAGTVDISCIASNGAGTQSASGTGSSTIVALPVITAFTATPSVITAGNASILAWTATGASALAIDNGVGTVTGQSSKNVNPAATTTYSLTATNSAGTAVASQATVTVAPAPQIGSFAAFPTSIAYGGTSTLTGVFSGGTGTIDHGLGAVTSTQTIPTGVLTTTTTFTLTVVNGAGVPVTATATVTVAPAPAAGTYTPTGGLPGSKRVFHTGTLLANGKILVAGGTVDLVNGLATAEIYDPATDTFAPTTGPMAQGRFFHTATALPSGKVLLVGGIRSFPAAPAGAEIFDPATGLFTATLNPPVTPRAYHTATLLLNGKVLVAGGTTDFAGALATAEVFDPGGETFTATGSMAAARRQATATPLAVGWVLMAGGSPDGATALGTAELYDYTLGTFSPTLGPMTGARFGHTASYLNNGTVLLAGGSSSFSTYLKTAEIYNPATNTFAATSGTMNDLRYWHAATTMTTTGNVLITGGTGIPSSASAEIFEVNTGLFKATVPMVDGRYGHAGPAISGTKVLLSCGQTVSGNATAEVFQ